MSHNPNPFDFVPFAENDPVVLTPEQWINNQPTLSGYLEVCIEALTPIHIVGQQEVSQGGKKIDRSHFCRRSGKSIIPSTTIRGMLRSFIEAACNCWTSQMTPIYKVEKDQRNLAFAVTQNDRESFEAQGGDIDTSLEPALRDCFAAKATPKGEFDMASFLFGYAPLTKDDIAWRGRIAIEDAEITNTTWAEQEKAYQMPDLVADAFMGRPNPSAKTWWYFLPRAIRKRRVHGFDTVEFLGKGFRGRKFYYHQDPLTCVSHYLQNWENVEAFDLECMPRGETSKPFRLSFNELPPQFIYLIAWALNPGAHVRHIIGYGKAYGFGSVKFYITNCKARSDVGCSSTSFKIDDFLKKIKSIIWNNTTFKKIGLDKYIDTASYQKLIRILYFEKDGILKQPFYYPMFKESKEGFLPPVYVRELLDVIRTLSLNKTFENDIMSVTFDEAYQIADALRVKDRETNRGIIKGIKPALHFEIYQDSAVGYKNIKSRSLDEILC